MFAIKLCEAAQSSTKKARESGLLKITQRLAEIAKLGGQIPMQMIEQRPPKVKSSTR